VTDADQACHAGSLIGPDGSVNHWAANTVFLVCNLEVDMLPNAATGFELDEPDDTDSECGSTLRRPGIAT
jgi:hypothetical protein